MAVYNITHLNYITTGTGRNFIHMDIQQGGLIDNTHILARDFCDTNISGNVILEKTKNLSRRTDFISREFNDVSSYTQHQISCFKKPLSRDGIPEGIILNEEQPGDYNCDHGLSTFVKLDLSCCDNNKQQMFEEFLGTLQKNGQIFEVELTQDNNHGFNILNNENQNILPLYDLDDLCVKSKFKQKNNKVHDWDSTVPGQSEDIYLPDGIKTIDVKQCGNVSYLMTEPTDKSPVYLGVEIQEYYGQKTSQHNMLLEEQQNNTYLYSSVEDLSGDETHTYRNVIDKVLDEEQNSMKFFTPNKTLKNIKYNYLYTVDMNKVDGSSGYQSDYMNGNLYGTIINTKNMYNSTYSMDMSSSNSIQNCRQYSEMMKCGGRIFLKYYDNIDYTSDNKTTIDGQLSGYNMHDSYTGYTFQKMEQLNTVKVKTSNDHKSYFFTVALDTEINSEYNSDGSKSSDNFRKMKDILKKDITNSIRKIVENVCPVQTQLLNVTFG